MNWKTDGRTDEFGPRDRERHIHRCGFLGYSCFQHTVCYCCCSVQRFIPISNVSNSVISVSCGVVCIAEGRILSSCASSYIRRSNSSIASFCDLNDARCRIWKSIEQANSSCWDFSSFVWHGGHFRCNFYRVDNIGCRLVRR